MVGFKRRTDQKKAQTSCKILNLRQNQENFYDKYVAHVEKMIADESEASRIAACRIIYAFYERFSTQTKDEMWKILSRLSVDDNLPVRKEVVTTLGNLAKEADTELYTSYIIPVLEKMEEQEQEKVEPCLELTQLIINFCTWPHVPADARVAVIPVLLKHARHPSWEVRYIVANNFKEVQKTLQAQILKSGLYSVLPNLMKDPEPIVREAADNQFEAYCEYLIETTQKCLPLP